MKDLNTIEKALQIKVNEECANIVDKFIADVEKLSNKYGGSMFYDFAKDKNPEDNQFHVQGTYGVRKVLQNMLLENHGKKMLKYKSQELIKKLDLI